MLHKQKILSFKVKNKILFGLNRIKNQIIKKKILFDSKDEDIHMFVENKLFEIIGEDAGYVHTARSRNDQVITDLKIWLRNKTVEIINLLNNTIKIIIKKSNKNIYTIMPGFTHLKNAQPVSFAHYLLAYVEMFNRDKNRFKKNLNQLLENPLGVGALTGTSFNIDRNYTTKKLKFKTTTRNSIDTVSDRDYVLDFLYSSSVCAMHISRMAEEFIIWNSDAFNLLNLNDNVVTGSSIMPQKKNPDAAELIRSKAGRVFSSLNNILVIQKGIPSGYSKDLQEDKELTFDSFYSIDIILDIAHEMIKSSKINKETMFEHTKKGFITATDLADWMVKKIGLTFRESHKKTGKIVMLAEKKNKLLHELSLETLQKIEPKITKDVFEILKIEKSISEKKSYGGTAGNKVIEALNRAKKKFN